MLDPKAPKPADAPARASIFDDDDIDVSAFTPKKGPDRTAPPAEQVRVVAEAAKFPSRERPKVLPAPAKREQRRYRTGRNVQFNIKASQGTVDAFYALNDQQGWVLGATLEYAVEALRKAIEAGWKPGE